jgi:hypothetical protein
VNDYTEQLIALLSTFAALTTLPVAILWDGVAMWQVFWRCVYVQETVMWGRQS